ncbi:hypothetical protein L873DRAFT_712627 [Choiromyces venosus 120613-1]|uniref:Uncharacterized protein n=1 Tax=Choiromyces venosus 120613-1 TaxID=1336337 RepID=A0A3N4JRH4_9PEZI|nr:hypothetical protein L873DRAFT_712627 [Choiromyces venosus 120613-1]
MASASSADSELTKVLLAFLIFAQHQDPVNGDFDQLLFNCYPDIYVLARKNPTVFGIPNTEEAIYEFLWDKLRVHFSEVNAIVERHGLIEIRSSPPDMHQDFGIEGTNAPIDASNNELVEEFVEAMKDATDTYDSPASRPYQKWQGMTETEYRRLSCRLVVLFTFRVITFKC